MEATITKYGALDMQVCVPKKWLDKQVLKFAEKEYPCGSSGWYIRKEGDEDLNGDPERNQCESLKGNVHIVLDA